MKFGIQPTQRTNRLWSVTCAVLLLLTLFSATWHVSDTGMSSVPSRFSDPHVKHAWNPVRNAAGTASGLRLTKPACPVNDALAQPRCLALSMETGTSDLDPTLLTMCRLSADAVRDGHSGQRALRDQLQVTIPLYLTHQSLRC